MRDRRTDVGDCIRAIGALNSLFDISDTPGEDLAIEAFSQGHAAYWRINGYSNQAASLVCDMANCENLHVALAQFKDCIGANNPEYLLDCIVPLNAEARAEIHSARSMLK